LSKAQKKKLARKLSNGGPIVIDTPVQTKDKPSDKAEGATESAIITNGSVSKSGEPTAPAAAVEADEWGFDKSDAKVDVALPPGDASESSKSPKGAQVDREAPIAPTDAGTTKATKDGVATATASAGGANGATSDDHVKTTIEPAGNGKTLSSIASATSDTLGAAALPSLLSPSKPQLPDLPTKSGPVPSTSTPTILGALPVQTPPDSTNMAQTKPNGSSVQHILT
jgi:hypothetical protein